MLVIPDTVDVSPDNIKTMIATMNCYFSSKHDMIADMNLAIHTL